MVDYISSMPPTLPASAAPLLTRPLVAVMSSGFFGFFAHAGFLQALEDLGIVPDAYAGTSSGALVAAFAAAGMTPARMMGHFLTLETKDFWDPPSRAALLRLALRRLRGAQGYLRGEAFGRLLEKFLPVRDFEELPRPCLMVALDLVRKERVVLDQGPLVPAIRASGAVPMMFEPVRLDGRLLVDGGLVDKAPLLPALERFQPASLVVHLLPSSSLEKPLETALHQPFTPFRLQARAIDAARQQTYQDHLDLCRAKGIGVSEVRQEGIMRVGPRRLAQGPQAFESARRVALACLQQK
ncbi:MAG: patatin-like phospholipase family protein [Deltaproteobacteria bacterium]|nr:patatin-like phospholipase family protein [Deltaproteobacteria bacterium]